MRPRRKQMFTVTELAAKEIQTLINQYNNPQLGLRVRVLAGGCSGYSYDLAFDDQVQENDIVFESHGVKVLIDDRSHKVLDGTQLDYVDTMLGRGFTFSNPNAKSSCGCGSSFNT
jgi:iron-sulfur cluster assembly accessory protein